jgi:hypothetical protein
MKPIMVLDLISLLAKLYGQHGNVPVTYWNCGLDQELLLEASDIEFIATQPPVLDTGIPELDGPRVSFP